MTEPARAARADVLYLDHNATTPVDPRVRAAMKPYFEAEFGNPSSAHGLGSAAAAAVSGARADVARLIGATPPEIVFTGSGSEADALAVRGTVLHALAADPARWATRRPHVVTQVSEHPAILAACRHLRTWHGVNITYLGVDDQGVVDPNDLAEQITERTVLVSIMHANNETGVIQPIAELAAIAHAAGSLFHTDAAQSAGRLAIDVHEIGADLLTVVGHKLYAPKGVAALFISRGVEVEPLIGGGGQEAGRRAGTENVALAVGLGEAARVAVDEMAAGASARTTALRDELHRHLERALPGSVRLNGSTDRRLPNTLNISIEGVDGEALLAAAPGIAASTGSACHAGRTEPSEVLVAMGQKPARALGAIRLSLGRWTGPEEVAQAARLIVQAAETIGVHGFG